MPNPKYYQITLPSGSTQIWDEEKVTRNKKWLEDKKATSEEVNQFEVTLPSGASQTWDADKYGRNIDWLNEHQASVRGSFLKDQQPQTQPTAEVKPEEPAVTAPPVSEPTQPVTDGKKDTKPAAPSFGLQYDPEHPWRIQKPGYETSPMPEEYRRKQEGEAGEVPSFDDEPQGPTWVQRQQAGNRKQVVKLSGRIDTMLNDAVTTSMQNYQREQQEMDEAMKQKGWFTRLLYFIGKNGGSSMDPGADMMADYYREFRGVGDPELQNRIASLNAAKKSMTNAQRMIAEADHNAQAGTFGKWLESSFLGGAARGFGQKLFDVSTWDMGMSDLEDAGAFMTALNAFDKGQQLTEAQQVMLDAKAVELATNAYFGSYVGRGYKAGSVTAESIPFMLEMCINPASSIGEAATSKMARYAISRFGKQAAKSAAHKVARAAGRAGADLVGAATMTATTGALRTAADAVERMNGEVTFDEDVNAPGISAFADHTPGEAPAVAIAKAFGSRTIENYSEMVGEYFAPVLGAAGHGVQKGLEKIGLGKVSQFIDDVAASDVGRLVSDFEHNAKWNGVFGEYAEEVVGSIMNALTVGDQTLDAAEGTGVFNLDQNIDTFLGVALMGGFMSGIKTAGYRTPKYRTRKGLEMADNAAGAAFDGTDWWEDIRNGIQANPEVALHDVLTSDALNPQQRRAAIEYAKAYQEYDGVLKAEAKRRTDEAADPRMNDLETSFDNGYELVSEQEMNDARNMYQAQKARLQQALGVDDIDETQALQQNDLPYSEEEKQTIMDYLNAKATYDGMIQRVRDDIDSRIEAANTQIDLNTNATTGRIHPAVTSDDRKVYIVGGNVKLYEDGSIDRETSDKDIIIRDQETMQKEFWDIGMLKSVEAPIDPVDEKNTAAASVREQVARQAADKMDGRLHFQMGDVYTLTTPEGSSFPVQITANEQGIIDNGDGTVNVILNGATVDGQPVISQMPKEQIQQMSDATNLGRLAAYQQQKAAEEAAKPAYVLDDVLTLDVNGTPVRGSITADADADGRYEVYTEAPIDGKKVNLFTREQLDAMVSEKNGEAVTRTEMPVSGTENATSGTVSPENSTVQPGNGTQAAPSDGTALSRIPVDENNVPQFEQAPLNDGWAALLELNDGNEQDTVDMANDMVVNAEAELQKAQKQKPKGTNPLEIKASRDEIRKAVAAAQNKVNFWKQIAGYPETLRKEMEAEARRQKRARLAEARKIQREQGRFGKEDRVLGDALSFEEYVMRTIANGAIRFKWGNDPNNAAIKGLGSHLGFTDNPAERNQRIWMLSNAEGLYPEAAAEELLQGYAEHLGVDEVPGMDTMDAFSTLLDVLLSYGSSRAMFDAAKELHQKNDPNFLETKQAEMAAAMAEDEAKNAQQQFNREVPETPEKARGVIATVVELAKTVKDRVERAIIAALTPRQKQDFADKGIDVTDNFVHSIENSAILHNQKEHGNPAVEEKRGQIAIEESDYALIPEILEDYDTVEKSPNKNKQGRDVIIYTKMYPDGTVYYLEEVRENRESLAFQTMYKKKSGSGSSDGLMQQDAASPSTPVAPSDNSVSVSDNKGSEISGENNTLAENPTVEAIQAAREEVNTEPTDAQKEAGNYKKGHVKIDGYDISIENPKGSVRRGTSPDGTQWETQMNNDYGYIRSTEGVDGDHIDVYLSDNPSEGNVYVIDQVDPSTGEFDEHKVMYGFPDEESARAAYLANYEDGWQGLGTITGVSKDEFKKWVDSSHRKTKPFSEYKSVKPVEAAPSGLGYNAADNTWSGIPEGMKVFGTGEADWTGYTYGYTPNPNIDLVHGHGQTFARVWVEDEFAETPAKIVIQLEKEGYTVGLHGERGRYVDFDTYDDAARFEGHVRDIEKSAHQQKAKPESVETIAVQNIPAIYGEIDNTKAVDKGKPGRKEILESLYQANPQLVQFRNEQDQQNAISDVISLARQYPDLAISQEILRNVTTIEKPVQSDIKSVADEDAEKQEYVRAVLALDGSVNTGDVFTNDNGGTIRIIEKKPKHQGYMVEINTPAFAGTVENTPAELYRRVNEEGYRKQERTPEPPTTPKGPKRVNVESLLGALSQNGEAKLSDHVEEETPETVTDSVTVEPAQYTRKDGKTIDMYRVNPGRELSHEEWSAVSKFLKEKRGWKDRENGGFMVRSEEDARALADLVRDDKAMSEARPVSLTDMQQLGSVSIDTSEVEAPKEDQKEPVWKYELTSVEGGRTYLSRSQVMPDGTEIYDGHFDVRADNPEEMKGILQNNGLYDTLSDFDKQMLERKIEHWQFRQRVQNEGINGLRLGDKVMYKGKEATVHDFEEYEDNRPVLDTGLAPVIYEIAESWDAVQKVEAPAATPAAEEQPGETQPERPVNPSGNKLVTDERYAELRLKMMQKLKGQMNMGIDPEILAIGTEMAVYHIEKGARKFVEYAKAMIADLSDAIRPYLKAFYNGARDLPEMQESGLAAEMDSYADVQAVDVANFDKDKSNVLDTVAAIEKEAEVAEQAQQGAEKLQKVRNTVASDFPASELEARRTFSRSVATEMIEAVSTGKRPFESIVDLRKLAEKCGMTLDKLGSSDILLQELVEDGLVTAARDIIESKRYGGAKSRDAYDAIVQLYEMQPSINQRSSNRIKMQQYSTPLPMAFVADMFAFHPGRTGSVLEPTAGNGMLVFAIPAERVHANELDETRLANLREQGFREVTSQDGALPFEGEYDAVIANPPFGSAEAKEYEGVSISGLDPQIALNALASMSDTGKAAIIVGGNLEYAANGSIKGGKKAFFSYLYDHYNVKGIVDMSGDLYKRQGTKFPTMMILIDGRRSEEERAQTKVYPPVKSAAIAKVNNFDELYDTIVSVLQSKQKTNGYETVRTQELGLFDNHRPSGESAPDGHRVESHENDSDVRQRPERGGSDRPSGRNGGTGVQRTSQPSGGRTPGAADAGVSGTQANQPGNAPASDNAGRSDGGTQRVADGSVPASGTPGSGVAVAKPSQPKSQQPKEERKLTDEKLHYVQHSSAFSLESVAPAAMVEAMDATLGKIETKYGMSIDDFVTDELGYDSVEAMHNALAAEQVDSVAMAIDQMKQGQALVIGDQTGVGKGRQMAALIRWATRQGKQPIFVTQKATLFTDIYRDLVDIGSGDLRPFIFNDDGAMLDATGKTIYKPLGHDSEKFKEIMQSGELPPEYDFAVLTYSQVNTGDAASAEMAYNEKKKNGARAGKPKNIRPNPKADFLRAIAKDNYLFLDESHTAAGKSKSGYYLQSLVKDAAAVTFASATFAKRPDTMPLYALRTAMSKAQLGEGKSLIGIIKRGGVTLQEIMSRALTTAGQMVRRERDMSDVQTDWETVTDLETVRKARENYDKTIEAFNDIINFQTRYVTPMIDALSGAMALTGSSAKHKQGTKKMGIDNVPFASKTYNYTKQLMLALKTDAIVDRVAKEIQEGRHPVIALESTMEALLKDYAPGEVIDNPTFAASLLRGLDTVLQYTVTDENGKETHRTYSPAELGEEGERAYYELRDKITEATSGIFISPLDAIIEGLQAKGFRVGELTGRSLCTGTDTKGRTVVRKRTDTDKLKLQMDFNSGALDVLILNKSASTGISLHASKKFKDQRQRSMIIAQPLSDINDYMQMIGRIDRTGQVSRGYYINLALPVPAEQRFNMMLSTKLKSLNANTTTSQDNESSSVEAPDLLNKYGSQVVVEYLRDNPDIYRKLGSPLKDAKGKVTAAELDEYKAGEEDARKITGYVALLSTKEQQDFYDDVIRRYNDLINYLNETGTNDLRITVMPLQAKTIQKTVSSEGTEPDGDNPFAQNAFVEKVEMNVLSKPMSADEIRKAIKKLNGDKTGAERRKEILKQLHDESEAKLKSEDERYEVAKAKAEEDIAKRTALVMAKDKMTDEEKQAAIEKFSASIREKAETSHEDNKKKYIASANALYHRMMYFDVGSTYLIADNLGAGGQSLFSSPAIFCGFKVKESKITASTTIAVFAPLDGRRRIEVKLSDMTSCNQIKDLTDLNYDVAQQTKLENWDAQIPNETRKEGYILTGNILQAIADTSDEMGNYTGQLVSFTDDEGNVRDGILMPDQWTPALLPSAGVPINARAAEIAQGRSFTSTDGNVSIQTGYFRSAGQPMYYYLSVPKSKAKGGKFFLNDELLSLLHGGEFTTRSGKMQATIWPDNLKPVLNFLAQMGVRVADSTAKGKGEETRRFRDGEGSEGIRFRDAFHGSPADFEEFDNEHIGEGEGHQSHGWGIYVSFDKETADRYAYLGMRDMVTYNGPQAPTYYAGELVEFIKQEISKGVPFEKSRKDILDMLNRAEEERKAGRAGAYWMNTTNAKEIAFVEGLTKDEFEVKEVSKNLYSIEVPDDTGDNYIEENKSLYKAVRTKIADALRAMPAENWKITEDDAVLFHDPTLPQFIDKVENTRMDGEKFYSILSKGLGSTKAASKFLSDAGFAGIKYIGGTDGPCAVIFDSKDITVSDHYRFRIREGEPPKKTGTGYKVFVLKNGQLYPPMVANPDGAATPVGVWLDADAAPIVGTSKTGRKKVKAGGKGTQGGSGTLAYRPGWHLGTIPYALQFNRKGESGERELFPADFVWAEVEYANDVDYQDEAMSYGYNEAGKFQHSLAGLPRLPENGSYTYRTNPDPKTDPWIITGAMKVKRLLTPSEVDEMVKAAGREPQKRQEGAVTDRQIENLNKKIASMASVSPDDMRGAVTELAGELGEKVRIIEDVNELKHTNPNVQRRMRNALGWYETESGEVVVVLPNARSVADARATIFHETVAHKGLRELVGKDRFDDFLERVYAGATKKTREAINALAKRHGWDLAEGTEEYIARLAESGFDERENASFWEKVRRFFEDMISEAKLRLGFRITDNDLRYALWRSYQMRRSKGALGVAEDVDMQQRLGVGNFRDGSRRFRDPDEVLHDRTLARDHYEKAVSSGLYQFREAVQDSMLGLRTLMQTILQAEGKGKVNIEDVDAFENAYLAENAMSSMNKAEQEAYYKLVMSPLLKAVSDLGVPQQEVTEYMMAKHGLERNRLMAERAATAAEQADEEHRRTHDEWLEHFRKNDYAGLIGLTGKKTVRDAEREALRIVNEFEADHDTTDLWAKTNAATKASLHKLYESGLLTKAGFDHISDMYEYYIPLRGWDETTSDELYGYLSERRGVLNSPLKKAEGRRSKADDPLAYIASMADTAIMQGNRNRMKQRFLNFVLNHPSDLVSVNDIWLSYDDTTDEWKPVFADLQPTDTAEDVEQKVADFEAKMQALSESDPDHYKSGKDAKNIPFKVVHDNLKEHQVLVKRGGKTYVLTINGNPRAAQALNGLTNPDTDISGFVGSLIKGGQFVNRNLSAFYTTRNVEFVASNFMRDMLYSNCMTWVKESPSYSLRFHKNFGRMNPGHMLALFTKWENGTLDESDQTEKMFKQFMMNGGETGYTTVKDIEKQKKEIASQIKKFGKTMPVTKAWEFLGTSFDVLNRAVENTARFAAFVTSREMGRTLERSVYDAKEVSVNFNKKGAGDKFAGAVGQTLLGQIGSYGSAAGRLLYVFWNAGVQGLTNFGRAAKRHPGKAAAGMASMFALGMAIAALAASGGDGDDDDANAYYNLPEYVRRSNICFRAGNSWITIPLPIEFRGIYGMGELAMGTITDKEHYSDKELAFQIGSQVSQVFPLDMLEGGGGISPFIPSAAKPVVEAYIMNKSWTGMPIYKDTYFNKDLPNWTKAYKSANKQLVELAEAANRMSGGDEFTKGAVDINPARVEYMLNGYFGGYSTLVNKLVKMAETATGQRDFEWRNMLVASRLVKSGDERTQRRKLTNDFFNIKDEAEQTQRRLRGYEDKADAGLADYAEKLDFLMNSPEYLRFEIYDEFSADLKDIREDMKEETDPEQYKVLEDEYYALMREMVDKVNESRKSKR